MKILIFFLLIIFYSQILNAKSEMLLLGVAAEPYEALDEDGKQILGTAFDNDLKLLSTILKVNPNWKVRSYINGGHPKTDELMATQFNMQTPNTPFTRESYEQSIKDLEERIIAGPPNGLGLGDQVIIKIIDHGSMKSEASGKEAAELTHSIAAVKIIAGKNKTFIWNSVSLDRLKNLADLAKSKGINLAILDFSCHSGNTLSLANSNTCVISSTGPFHYSQSAPHTFSNHFINESKPGRNLEEIFLAAREKFQYASFPMISTEVGRKVQEKLYPLLTPYLYYFDLYNDKLSNYLINESLGFKAKCESKKAINKLDQLLIEMGKVSEELGNNLAVDEFKQLKASIKEYYDYQHMIRMTFINYGADAIKADSTYCPTPIKPVPAKPIVLPKCIVMRLGELLALDIDAKIAMDKEHLSEEKDPYNKLYWVKALEIEMEMKQYKNKMLKRFPKFNKFKEFIDSLPDKTLKTYALANKVTLQSRNLYNVMYAQLNKSNSEKSNVCKNIKM